MFDEFIQRIDFFFGKGLMVIMLLLSIWDNTFCSEVFESALATRDDIAAKMK